MSLIAPVALALPTPTIYRREKQDKIALGLLPAPEPKMKMSNFMQVRVSPARYW